MRPSLERSDLMFGMERSVTELAFKDSAAIVALGTAEPPHMQQAELGAWLKGVLHADGIDARLIDRLFARSPIASRPLAFADTSDPYALALYENGLPSLAQRMKVYESQATRLALSACRRTLAQASLPASDVTHLIMVTSTGAGIPGPDVHVSEALNLDSRTMRLSLSGQGCAGAIHGLSTASLIARADPSARVLMCCVEICSIHLRDDVDIESLVANSLFSDSAAAVLVRSDTPGLECIARIGSQSSLLEYAHRDLVSWRLEDSGFALRLSRELPRAVASTIRGFLTPLAQELPGVEQIGDVRSWCVHPGGSAVLHAIRDELNLGHEALRSSFEVLHGWGNLSSATVLFVLERERHYHASGTTGLMVAFGPGLALEALSYQLGSEQLSTTHALG
jgi:predicted naringenin-chalcone synthase